MINGTSGAAPDGVVAVTYSDQTGRLTIVCAGTPRGSRVLTCFWQAVLGLRWSDTLALAGTQAGL